MADLLWIPAPQPLFPEVWEWPMAVYKGPANKHAAYILGSDPYTPLREKTGMHRPLGVVILHHNSGKPINPARMLFDYRFQDLRNAIEFVQLFLDRCPQWHPTIL
jgi:hypothetical protein